MKDKKLLEGVQRRATKLVPDLKELPYKERLRKLKLPSLYYRQACEDAIEAYKYTHDFYSVSEDLLPRDTGTVIHNNEYKLKKRRPNFIPCSNFFNYRIVESWNTLPSAVVNAPTLIMFQVQAS